MILEATRPGPGFHAAVSGAPAIATRGLVKRYGKETALAGVDLTAPEGGVYLLAGANGAGKSSLLRILLNLMAPTAGSASVLDLDSRRDGPTIRAEVGYVPETHQIGYRWMPVGRLMDHMASYYPRWDQPYADQLSRRLDNLLTGGLNRAEVQVLLPGDQPVTAWRQLPSLANWAPAAAAWLALSGGLLWLAAWRHRER